MVCEASVVLILGFLSRFFFRAEDGIRDLVRSRGLGDVYKRQIVVLLYGAALLIGAFTGGKDALRPLPFLSGTAPDLSLIHI